MGIRILDTNELVRILNRLQDPRSPTLVSRQSCKIALGTDQFEVDLPIIERAIEQGFLVRTEDDPHERYELDDDLVGETWIESEDVRVAEALEVLNEYYPADGGKFVYKGYRVLMHPRCATPDTRGFVFDDMAKHEYLVTKGGGILHILSSVSL